ncbi:YdhK family protein [Virgibacillus sediminis]|uniref:DUF1541 domain-containing protein n=1 Tax=Virgibacillus sediminis TaxID=202260 RepID=A0ABV7A287_9BACI
MRKIMLGLIMLAVTLVLAACGGAEEENSTQNNNEGTETEENMEMQSGESDDSENRQETKEGDTSDEESMEGHNHSSSGEVPASLEEAENPAYEPGSQAVITEGHMEGMEGAEATITGAYDTTAYMVSYTPVDGGEPVENHKWVIHEELENPGEEPLEPGEEVTLNADHMQGMDGATAEIDEANETTVYMVDFTTADGQEVTNHKWVTEGELAEE